MSAPLRNTWLVQRLQKPRGFVNPFSFGGGYQNGGLSDDAMELLMNVCAFDYMGAAEYEFGDVPKAFQRIVEHEPATRTITIQMSDVVAPFVAGQRKSAKSKVIGERTAYIIGPKAYLDEIEQRVREIASWTHNDHGIKNDYQSFARALVPVNEWDNDTCGWLEIDNGFLFFTDEEMFNNMADLFGVQR